MAQEEPLSAIAPARVACFRCDSQLRYRDVQVFGKLPLEWEGASDRELFPKEVAERMADAKRRALTHVRMVRVEEELTIGATVVHSIVYLMPEGDGLRGVLVDASEIAQLVDERNLLRHLTELSSDYGYVVKFTRGGRLELEWTVAGLFQSTGYTLDELRARGGWPTLIHPDDIPLLMEEIEAVVRDETHAGEFRLVTKSGKVRWIGNRARLLPGESDHGELRVAGTARDVTEQKRAEDAAHRLQDELAHVMRLSSLGEMASGIAHELNQPLAAIINYADACAMALTDIEGVPDPVYRDLEQIAEQAERAADIIRQLRGLVAKRDSRHQSTDVNGCVEDVVSLLETVARNRGVVVRVDLGDAPQVLADPVQVQQVVLNLVQNAFDAVAGCPEDRRVVHVRTERVPVGAAISIRDFGGVVAHETVERMFDPFFSTKAEGLGMGLTIGRTIAESHGGSLEAEALAEGGMRLWFVLPERSDE